MYFRQEIVSIEDLVLELEQKIDLNLGERLNKHYISKIRMLPADIKQNFCHRKKRCDSSKCSKCAKNDCLTTKDIERSVYT